MNSQFSSDIIPFTMHYTFSWLLLWVCRWILSLLLSEKGLCFHLVKGIFTRYRILVDCVILLFTGFLYYCVSLEHNVSLFQGFYIFYLFLGFHNLTMKNLVLRFFVFVFLGFDELLQLCGLLYWSYIEKSWPVIIQICFLLHSVFTFLRLHLHIW